jgi:hypothetical protein
MTTAATPPVSSTFIATAWGYTYEWTVMSGVLTDTTGRLFLWAKPTRRMAGRQKRGRIRAATPWFLTNWPAAAGRTP